jgi:hypothetical protein
MSTYFKTGGGQNAFTVEERISDYLVSYPLGAAEPTALVIDASFMQTRANYSRPAANAVLSYNGSNAYFVDDQGFSDVTAGVTTWGRKWATIPASWSEYEDTSYEFPSYIVGVAYGTTFNVTNIATSGANVVLTTSATNVVTNDTVFLDLAFTRNSKDYRLTYVATAIAASSGVSVTVPNQFPASGNFTNVSGTLREGQMGRTLPEQLVVTARVLHDYALTSESALDTDLPAIEAFAPVNSSGYEVKALSTGTATVPNSDAYFAMIKAGTEIAVERSSRSRYMGNIYVRRTRFVKAR